MQEKQIWSLGQEEPLEKQMATHSSILAWRIPWTEEPGELQSMGLKRVSHDWGTNTHTHTHTHTPAYLILLIFLPVILILALSHPVQRFAWCTPHIIWISRVTVCSVDILLSQFWTSSMSSSNCCFLFCIQVSQEAGQVVWYSICIVYSICTESSELSSFIRSP